MKKCLALLVTVIVSLSIASFGFAAGLDKCEKCHKGDKAPDKMIAKAKIGTAADLMKALKEGLRRACTSHLRRTTLTVQREH